MICTTHTHKHKQRSTHTHKHKQRSTHTHKHKHVENKDERVVDKDKSQTNINVDVV